jgi:predicted outer membrane protein
MSRIHRLILCLALLGCGTAWAQNATAEPPSRDKQHTDQHFAREVSNANNAEIMASQIALQNTQGDDVKKQFAQRMMLAPAHGSAKNEPTTSSG